MKRWLALLSALPLLALAAPQEKIVTLGGDVTEIVYALGAASSVARRNFSHRNALNYAPQQTSEKPLLRTVQIKTPRSLSHSNDEAGNLR